eukprot:766665-Hanusia_phi.AAC.5
MAIWVMAELRQQSRKVWKRARIFTFLMAMISLQGPTSNLAPSVLDPRSCRESSTDSSAGETSRSWAKSGVLSPLLGL